MPLIPKNHPRAKSLFIREKLVHGFDNGLVAKEGLMAHGRGEAFDYLLGEKTLKSAKKAIKAASSALLLANSPVISVNGNTAALCPKEIIKLARSYEAKIEVNLFYTNEKRKQKIVRVLKKNGAKEVLGINPESTINLKGLESARKKVDKDGINSADVVIVPLEDGDRTLALKKARKKVITFDLNPLSRTAQTADITIVDNVIRGLSQLVSMKTKLVGKNKNGLKKIIKEFNNTKNLSRSVSEIKNNLKVRIRNA